ncbi:unnamed protein product [Meganyctiphanes norvegica]|uniref:Peptidase S1 domain-containing protein n=1 Tax=Meganyctiphanes norvegica TaxID=48144 RepID=A0AAV2QP07_MEGNR
MRAYTIVAVVVTYMSICRGQVNFGSASNRQGGITDTRLGLLASQLGVAPVPGLGNSLQGRPGQQNNFPSNSGGGIFNQPNSFNPAGFPGPNSTPGSGASSCFCHPRNQACPPGSQRSGTQPRTSPTSVRIANVIGQECPGQSVCCPAGATGGPVQQGPGPSGPIVQQDCGVRALRPSNNNPLEASIGEFPWMTLIVEQNNNYVGGGALIADDWILTAAHKVHPFRNNPRGLKIRVGDHDVTRPVDNPQFPHQEVNVQQIIIHPLFELNNLHNNVALLRLSRPVNRRGALHIERVCLPEQGQLFSPQRCFVSGWGENAFNGGNIGITGGQVLKKVDVPIWDPFVCESVLREQPRLGERFNLDKTSFLCAGGEQGKDACTGDGGAPLVCQGSDGRFAVVGLVAWGIGCAKQNIPGVYVNVPNYVNFIRQNTGI